MSDVFEAIIRKAQGRLLLLEFDGKKPKTLSVEGCLLNITDGSNSSDGIVLPGGNSRRIALRLKTHPTVLDLRTRLNVSLKDVGPPDATIVKDAVRGADMITNQIGARPTFSVFTLGTKATAYQRMKDSFLEHGFDLEKTEFVVVDHFTQNLMEGHEFVAYARRRARGDYILFCHDDVEVMQHGFDELVNQLNKLSSIDPHWMLAGVAGGVFRSESRQIAKRISDRFRPGAVSYGPFPRKVESLDECFFIVPASRFPQSTVGMTGYHLYATDLCLQAELAGGSAYVIDFHIFHHGRGRTDESYVRQKEILQAHYGKIWPGRVVQTTTGILDLTQP